MNDITTAAHLFGMSFALNLQINCRGSKTELQEYKSLEHITRHETLKTDFRGASVAYTEAKKNRENENYNVKNSKKFDAKT